MWSTYVQNCMQWGKIACLRRFELEFKSGPFETGGFGENRQRAGDNGDKRPGSLQTATWLAQLGERRSAEWEVAGSNPGRTNT